jgi:hypothetical protein
LRGYISGVSPRALELYSSDARQEGRIKFMSLKERIVRDTTAAMKAKAETTADN